jgi:hypothetical protein
MSSEEDIEPTSAETESMRALSAEARETVVLTKQFYSCVVKDPRHASGEFTAVRPNNIPRIEGLDAFLGKKPLKT